MFLMNFLRISNMIKKIHYVWLGGKPLPASVKSCIKSWKKYMPDWEIIQWNESNFDVDRYRWVKEALEMKQYAFAADFIRLCVLEKWGGIYADTDVEVVKPIDAIIDNSFVGAFDNHRHKTGEIQNVSEDGIDKRNGQKISWFCLQSGFFYSEPAHPFVKRMLEKYYDNGKRAFLNSDGTNNAFVIDQLMMWLLNSEFGAKFRDETQLLCDDMMIYNGRVFATRKTKCSETYAIHWYDQSWKEDKGFQKIKKTIKKYLFFLYRLQ